MRQEFLKAVTSEDMAGIVRAMISKAKEGDVAAAKLVLQYTLGKPAQTVDPDRLDETEWEQWQREVVQMSGAHAVFKSCAAVTACVLARALVPVLQETMFKGIAATVKESDRQRGASAKPQAANKQRETTSKQDERKGRSSEEQKARRAQRQAAMTERVETAPEEQTAAVPASPETAKTPRAGEGAREVSPNERQMAEQTGQGTTTEEWDAAMAKLLRMMGGTVNKRAETARGAANDFDDGERRQAPSRP
jgi:hypothetical protein